MWATLHLSSGQSASSNTVVDGMNEAPPPILLGISNYNSLLVFVLPLDSRLRRRQPSRCDVHIRSRKSLAPFAPFRFSGRTCDTSGTEDSTDEDSPLGLCGLRSPHGANPSNLYTHFTLIHVIHYFNHFKSIMVVSDEYTL